MVNCLAKRTGWRCGTTITPATAPTIRSLTDLHPRTLGLMHGPSFSGDVQGALHALAGGYDERFRKACV